MRKFTAAIILAISLLAASCEQNKVDSSFLSQDEPGFRMKGKELFTYNPLNCQYSFNRENNSFGLFTDTMSDFVFATLSEMPAEKGQKLSGEIRWTTERDIKTQKISALKVVKIEDGKVWLWNSTDKIGLCVFIAD